MTDPRNRQYTNGEITVFWIPTKCIHATTCFRELIEVFNPGRRPWVIMDGAPTRRITEVVNKCPTQAIIWKYNKDLTEVEQAAQRQVTKEEVNPETISETPGQGEKNEQLAVETRVKPTSIRIMKVSLGLVYNTPAIEISSMTVERKAMEMPTPEIDCTSVVSVVRRDSTSPVDVTSKKVGS